MRYLSLPELEQINSLLSRIESDDGSRITGRLEAYSCNMSPFMPKLNSAEFCRQSGGRRQEIIKKVSGTFCGKERAPSYHKWIVERM